MGNIATPVKMKISVVMASYLSEYAGGATDRVNKFHRAVDSFTKQTYQDKELIIVSDGCTITAMEFDKHYRNRHDMKLIILDKKPLFSGEVRNAGCFTATGEIISYLDTDDIFGAKHLNQIINGFENNPNVDWVYFDDIILWRFNPTTNEIMTSAIRESRLDSGTIGTSSIAHRRLPEFNWLGCNGYGHDWIFIKRMINSGRQHIKISGCEYYVCHIPNSFDS